MGDKDLDSKGDNDNKRKKSNHWLDFQNVKQALRKAIKNRELSLKEIKEALAMFRDMGN